MDSTEAIYRGIKNAGIDFIVTVPCINLKKLIEMVEEDDEIVHVPVTREEEGLGICAGAYLAGKKTGILMQNSGLGNSINALTSLYELYSLPIVMIVSHRGTKGEPIIGQVPMGKATPELLESIAINYEKINNPKEAEHAVTSSWEKSESLKKPVALLFDINYW